MLLRNANLNAAWLFFAPTYNIFHERVFRTRYQKCALKFTGLRIDANITPIAIHLLAAQITIREYRPVPFLRTNTPTYKGIRDEKKGGWGAFNGNAKTHTAQSSFREEDVLPNWVGLSGRPWYHGAMNYSCIDGGLFTMSDYPSAWDCIAVLV